MEAANNLLNDDEIAKQKRRLKLIEDNTRQAYERAYGFERKTVKEILEHKRKVDRARQGKD